MEESSVCLRRSCSLPSPTSSEEKKRNTIQRALTSSVSFGRFMSESLDWEKWSAFTHNRYLEEVEKYSKPGSVAEKKAYFEAHYKRKRAAALVEQQNGAATDFSQGNIETKDENSPTFKSDLAQKDTCALAEKLKEGVVHNCDTVFPIGQGGCYDAEIDRKLGDVEPKGVEQVTGPPVFVENLVGSTNHPENDECLGDIVSNEEDKDACTLLISASSREEKPCFSSSKLLTNGRTFKQVPSGKQEMPVQLRNSDKTTLKSKSDARDSVHKRKSNSTSLHLSINFASCSGETQKATSLGLTRIANSRLTRAPVKKSGNNKLPQTLTRASASGVFGHHSATIQSENRMIKLHNDSLSGSRMMGGKVQSPSTSYSRSSNTLGVKERSLTVSSSFTFKSEERAAKRKEFFQKLEQKLKSNDSDKQQLHLKPQSTAATSPKIKEKVAAKVQDNARRFSPKTKENEAAKGQDNGSRPTWGFANKIENSKDARGKNNRPPIYSAKSFSKKSISENASPNIQ